MKASRNSFEVVLNLFVVLFPADLAAVTPVKNRLVKLILRGRAQ